MLDNLRSQATFEPEEEPVETPPEKPKPPKPRRTFDQMTGTNDRQRLLLALMLMVSLCLVGVVILVITGKWVLPLWF
jgi:hypothetical protein